MVRSVYLKHKKKNTRKDIPTHIIVKLQRTETKGGKLPEEKNTLPS